MYQSKKNSSHHTEAHDTERHVRFFVAARKIGRLGQSVITGHSCTQTRVTRSGHARPTAADTGQARARGPRERAGGIADIHRQPNSRDRLGELETLCKLDSLVLAQHAGGVADALGDTDWRVRFWSVNTLGELEIHILTEHAGAIAEMLKDANWHVRALAVKILGNLV